MVVRSPFPKGEEFKMIPVLLFDFCDGVIIYYSSFHDISKIFFVKGWVSPCWDQFNLLPVRKEGPP